MLLFYNLALCEDLTFRDYTTCRIVKVLDNTELKEVFKLWELNLIEEK